MEFIPIRNSISLLIMFMGIAITANSSSSSSSSSNSRRVIQVNGDPDSVIWVVQLSDLHFSVNHHDRARDFINFVGPTLSFVNPSLVLITGDLTDAKSKDMLTTKQDELEWVEYRNVIEHVVQMSGLDKSVFYDMRGNHDNYGVPSVGGLYDFFSNYSVNAQLGRSGRVNSVTLQTRNRRHLFVGIDATMGVGVRGPTNLLGHPTDELLSELDSELSQWDGVGDEATTKPVTKISFGHFPISFSAASESGKNLKDVFLEHSISAYLCGHLHMSFGKNLKRHHQPGNEFMQLNMHRSSSGKSSNGSSKIREFWEWEMGDWRSRRAMRILAVDRGHTSFVDVDLRSVSKNIIVLPTFPLDSRLMWSSSLHSEYKRQTTDPSDYLTIRALVFSSSPINSVVARVYDSRSGDLSSVLESSMTKIESGSRGASRGALYAVPWNFKAFDDPNPERYWLQIEATDVNGRSTLTDLRPFSINGVRGSMSWTWLEFKVMGCQFEALYLPILWLFLGSFLAILLIPVALKTSSKKYTFQNFVVDKGFVNGVGWVVTEVYTLRFLWYGILGYVLYLVLCPWLSGVLFTEGGERGYMTYKGWVSSQSDKTGKLEYIGFPDVMVIVIPHVVFVVLPFFLLVIGLTAESEIHRVHLLALSGKKEDGQNSSSVSEPNVEQNGVDRHGVGRRWIRKFLLLVCFGIFYCHFRNCRALAKAYEMNPFLHFPVYCFWVPILLSYAIYRTHNKV